MSFSDADVVTAALATVQVSLVAVDGALRVVGANELFLQRFKVTREETVGRFIYELGNRQWDIPELRQRLTDIFENGTVVSDYRIEHSFERVGRLVVRLNAKAFRREDGEAAVLVSILDETERERLHLEAVGRIEFADKLIDSVREALVVLDSKLRVRSANQPFYDLFAVAKGETEGQLLYELGNGGWDVPELRRLLEDILATTPTFDDYEVHHTFPGIGRRTMLLNARRLDHLHLILLAIRDVTEKHAKERARDEADRRQKLLLELNEALKDTDIVSVQAAASEILGRQLEAGQVAYAEIDQAGDHAVIEREWNDGSIPSNVGVHVLEDFGNAFIAELKQGRTIVIDDVTSDARTCEPSALRTFEKRFISAFINVPLIKSGRLVAVVAIHSRTQRRWRPIEISLAEEVAERTWSAVERAGTDAALRRAHDTFRNLVELSPFGIYVVDADLRLVQVSAGAQKVFENVRPLIGRDFVEVLRIIWPEPFAADVIAHFRHTLTTGEPYHSPNTVEKRADTPSTNAYDWRLQRVSLPDGRPGVVCHFYDLSERQMHEEQVRLLMREVNHRSKNMLGLIQAIAHRTVASSSQDFLKRFDERIHSLATAQDLLVRHDWRSVPLADLIHSQLNHFGERINCAGPSVELTPQATQSVGMALHELATNASKYGALSNDRGHIDIKWKLQPAKEQGVTLSLSWQEFGGPPVITPERRGFGSNVITSAVEMSTRGVVELEYAPSGILWCLTCDGQHVLAGSPGGEEEPLSSATSTSMQTKRVLVVEDEPILASDTADVLAEAGFDVIGPAGDVRRVMALIDKHGCDAAVLDVNLGHETSEAVARRLKSQGTPFVVVTGYSDAQLPTAYSGSPLLKKPLRRSALQEEVRRCLGAKANASAGLRGSGILTDVVHKRSAT